MESRASASACQLLQDKQEIIELIYTYAHAIDTGDIPRFLSIFADDARFVARLADGGAVHAEAAGTEGLKAFATRVYANASASSQSNVITQPLVELDGDRAMAVCYYNLFRVIDGTRVIYSSGKYFDKFIRRPDGKWVISERTAELGSLLKK